MEGQARVIEIDYSPRNWAVSFHNFAGRWMVMVMHRRAGKTTAVLNHLERDALRIPDSRFAYIAPTYREAKRIAWDILKVIAWPVPGVKFNEAELRADYPNGGRVQLFGADNPDSLRGLRLWGVAFDEYSQQDPMIFGEIISKALADTLGYAIWIGTIKGKNHLYRLWFEGNKASKKEWFALWQDIDKSLATETGRTIDNLRQALEDDKKLVAQGLMTQAEIDQEWYLSTEAAIRGAYYARELAQARNDNRIKAVPYDPALMVHTVWDLGKGPKMVVGFYQKTGHEPRMIDFEEGAESDGLPQMIEKVLKKKYVYGKHFAPHDIKVTELATGKTRFSVAAGLGIDFEVVPSVSVDDGIERGRLFLARLWIDEIKCAAFLDAIAQYRQEWDADKGMYRQAPVHDWASHSGDLHRYAALVEDEMDNEKPKRSSEVPPAPQWPEYEQGRRRLLLDEAMGYGDTATRKNKKNYLTGSPEEDGRQEEGDYGG